DVNVDAVELLAELLRGAGHDVSVAHDGHAALLALQEQRPEIAILDLGLPVMDGYELATRIIAECGDAAPYLIALTGYGQDHDRRRSLAAGFHEHMVKPVDPEGMLRTLAMARAPSEPKKA